MECDYPILSPPGTWAFVLEMVCRDARSAEFTPDSAVYMLGRWEPAGILLEATRQWECCDNGKQWVAAVEGERIVAVQHIDSHDNLGDVVHTYWWTVEFYATDDAYEDRLDELATVAVVAC